MSPQTEKIEESIAKELTNGTRLMVGSLDIRVDLHGTQLTNRAEAEVLDAVIERVGRSTRQTDPKARMSKDRVVVGPARAGKPR